MDQIFQNIRNHGTYYLPAWKHYGKYVYVKCDRCGRNNLPESYGWDKYDLCIQCIDDISNDMPLTERQGQMTLPHRNINNLTRMRQNMNQSAKPKRPIGIDMSGNPTDDPMHMTLMVQSMYNPDISNTVTFMMQTMFNSNIGRGNANSRRSVDAYDTTQYGQNEGVSFDTSSRFVLENPHEDNVKSRKKRDIEDTRNAYVPNNDDHWFGNVRASNSL